tara:strand:- start:338 stop:451 length:114 start_codon:yes stop_codon:yes gene_type:complete
MFKTSESVLSGLSISVTGRKINGWFGEIVRIYFQRNI